MATQDKKCFVCQTLNVHDAAYCTRCGGALPCFDVGDAHSVSLPKADSGPKAQKFSEPITPKIDNKRERIVYAVIAAPLTGLIVGGVPSGWLGIGLEAIGAPSGVGTVCAVLGIVAVTALVAYVIVSERFTGITARPLKKECNETQTRSE